ncbi:hypothetical protein V5N11_014455 [Cardamine amara subsp. amara]|uniref:MULE transposase N-terminal all-beta domain-containing protein n=1 Tax=Cardamine amara subsp. amara TaxID=228776 RepID=A0ABD0ZQT8_CARAN
MKKKSHTNVHFDYGGYYSEEHEWISRNSIYGISFKTAYLEEITYSVLVDKICMKIATLETSGKLKLSYSLSKSRRESYIVDDEDVYVFITSVDKEGLKPVLNVELLIDLENNRMVEARFQERRSEVHLV